MKAISIKELKKIADKYSLRRDIRAEAEIKESAYNAVQWSPWLDPAQKLPENAENVLAIIQGHIGKEKYTDAFILASYWEGDGWMIEGKPQSDDEDVEFKVEWWTPLPQYPGEAV